MSMSLPEIALRAREQLSALTGLKAGSVSSLQHDDQGWRVVAEMVELKRIPESADILASYELLLDETGALLSYQRTRRYNRGDSIN
jgi:hypothetical protein